MFWTMTFLRMAMALSGLDPASSSCQYDTAVTAPPCPALPCPAPCRVAADVQPVKPMAIYQLSLRQTGDRASTMTWPKVALSEHNSVTMTTHSRDKAGQTQTWNLLVRHCGNEGEQPTFEVKVFGSAGGKKCQYETRVCVPVGKEQVLALGGNTPEPLCLSLRAERLAMPAVKVGTVLPAPVPMPMPQPKPAMKVMNLMPVTPVTKTLPSMPPPIPVRFDEGGNTSSSPWEVCPVMPPMPVCGPMGCPMVHPVAFNAPAPAPLCFSKTVSLVRENGKRMVQVSSSTGTSKATRMVVEECIGGKVTFAASTKGVQLTGEEWSAQADKVELIGDGRVVLRGHAKLSSDKLGDDVTVSGDKITFRVCKGRFVELLTK